MATRVVSSAALPLDVAAILGAGVEYVAPTQGHLGRRDLLAAVEGASGLIALLTDDVDSELLVRAPDLKVVANFAVGFDNVDVDLATRRGIAICNTPDVLTETTADFAFALLLAAARRLVEGDRLARSGTWTGWEPGQLLGSDVYGATLGIVGLGRIGQAVARRAMGFGMNVLYAGPRDVQGTHGWRRVPLRQLLEESDMVTLHCPLTPQTHHIIDRQALAVMKPTAILVNTARGACIDEEALADALLAGEIGSAGLDVFAEEPHIHPTLLANSRVVLAPHAGSATTRTRRRMGEMCARAVQAVLTGQRPDHVVNPEVLGE